MNPVQSRQGFCLCVVYTGEGAQSAAQAASLHDLLVLDSSCTVVALWLHDAKLHRHALLACALVGQIPNLWWDGGLHLLHEVCQLVIRCCLGLGVAAAVQRALQRCPWKVGQATDCWCLWGIYHPPAVHTIVGLGLQGSAIPDFGWQCYSDQPVRGCQQLGVYSPGALHTWHQTCPGVIDDEPGKSLL